MSALEDLRLLRAFVRIVESGSISAAARVLHISQPTLSRQLRQLENETGIPLLRRDTHTMSLTEAGRTLLKDARDLLGLAEAAAERLQSDRETPRGHLRVVSVVDFGQWIGTKILAKFCEQHPQVTAELHLLNRPTKYIEEGFDCGLVIGELTDKSVVARRIMALPRHLVASPKLLEKVGIPKTPADLKDLPWLGVLQPHFYSRDKVVLYRDGKSCSLMLKPRMLLDTVTGLREVALAGVGFTMQPDWLVHSELANGQLIKVLPAWQLPDLSLYVVHLPHRHLPGRVKTFVEFALREIPLLVGKVNTGQKN
jgi:DNA-binding transcriptional LysR family regulator